ncbi:hypothetical protein [Salinicola halophilus]|uniref:hypothetical protein n=1 Tax=Salinicola halophilus TaxID=184065 RepID=UPI000DA11811|nr:hypothetical protein [Salinicola halophilus]
MKVSTFESVGEARQYYFERVEALAGAARARHVTQTPGQAEVYATKLAEARTVLAGVGVDTPILAAEAEATGQSVQDLAQIVTSRNDEWLAVAPAIEKARQCARRRIRAADAATDMHAALAEARDALVRSAASECVDTI